MLALDARSSGGEWPCIYNDVDPDVAFALVPILVPEVASSLVFSHDGRAVAGGSLTGVGSANQMAGDTARFRPPVAEDARAVVVVDGPSWSHEAGDDSWATDGLIAVVTAVGIVLAVTAVVAVLDDADDRRLVLRSPGVVAFSSNGTRTVDVVPTAAASVHGGVPVLPLNVPLSLSDPGRRSACDNTLF